MKNSSLFIRWSMCDCGPSHEEHRYIGDWDGDILTYAESGRELKVGQIHVQAINLAKVESELGLGLGLGGLLDGIGGDEENMFSNIIDGQNEEVRADLAKVLYGDDSMHDLIQQVLHIERVTIRPKYRGHGAGLWAIRAAIARFESGGETLVYALPKPLQYCGEKAGRGYPKRADENVDTVKLVRHYEKVGLIPFFPDRKSQIWPKNFQCEKHEVVMVGLAHRILTDIVTED